MFRFTANDHNIELTSFLFYHNDDINDSNGTKDPFAP